MERGITIHIPELPLVELLLLLIVLLLVRILSLLQSAVQLLRQMNKGAHSYPETKEASRDLPKISRQNRYPVDMGPTRSDLSGRQDAANEKAGSGERAWGNDQPARPLKVSAGHFAKCLSGDSDVDVALFIAACQKYCKVLTLIGPFTLLSIREVNSNMKKIEHSFELAPLRYRSMRELLEAEAAAGMHQPGGLIVDPSAAMGLLWARRGLQFWIIIYRELLTQHDIQEAASYTQAEISSGSSPRINKVVNLKEIVERSYATTLQPFFGWLSHNSMLLALRAVPAEFPVLAPTKAELLEDLREWSDVVSQVVERMAAMQEELDLEDKRKSI